MMHDECMVGLGGTRLRWQQAIRDVPETAQLHKSVYDRLAMPRVRNFTSYGPYRPAALEHHQKAKAYFTTNGGPAQPDTAHVPPAA